MTFPELDPPLVEGIDTPNGAFDENRVLVKCDQLAQDRGRELRRQNGGAGPIPGHDLVGHDGRRCPLPQISLAVLPKASAFV